MKNITLKDLQKVYKKFYEKEARAETDIEIAIVKGNEYGRYFNHGLNKKDNLAKLTTPGESTFKQMIKNYSSG